MAEQSVTHSTFVIERSYPVSPERVFSAFADPTKKRRWFAESKSSEVEDFKTDFRVGGIEQSRFRAVGESPVKGMVFTNVTTYQDIVPNRRIVVAYTMAMGEARMSASLATFEFVPAGDGTRLIFTEQGAYFENADGPRMREDGWRKLLEGLAKELGIYAQQAS